MKKTMIALAVAAAMPVAAQADVTLSGYVQAQYAAGTYSMETDLDFAVTEVLTNGMTASAGFDVDSNTNGSASLSGDFGTVKFSSAMDVNTGADLGDVAGLIENTDAADADPAVGNGASYTGTFAGLSVAVSSTSDSDATANLHGAAASAGYTAAGATYDFNGLTLGVAQMSGDAANSVSAIGATYSFGDLSVSGGSSEGVTEMAATYNMSVDALAITAEVSDNSSTGSDWGVEATYTIGEISVGVETGQGDETALTASYTSGALSVVYDEGETNEELTVSYDMGNADLSVIRDTTGDATTVKYKVSF